MKRILITFSFILWLSVIHCNITTFEIQDNCKLKAKCEPVKSSTCFGTTLTFPQTSIELANDSYSQEEIEEKLKLWEGLKNVPNCWKVIQPLLCAIYMPKCENDMVELPNHDMCEVTRNPCRIVDIESGWPNFLDCNDINKFPESCENVYMKIEFNITAKCESPLVETTNEASWYKDVEGCGIQCQNPLFTNEEHYQVHLFIATMATICIVLTLFTVITFVIDWKKANVYPAVIIFYMNSCFCIASIAWLAQFTEGAREDIVCRKDGTLRIDEPSPGENLSCVIVFVLVYYFLIASSIWFVFLSYAWLIFFQKITTPKGDIFEKKSSYFHIISWSIPLVLVIIILAVGKVDGDSVSGICFVGYVDHYYRAGFVLFPIAVILFVGGYFLLKGLFILFNLKKNNPERIKDKVTNKTNQVIIKIGIFAFLSFFFVFTSFACHLYDFTNQEQWEKGFRNFILCEANVTIYDSPKKDINGICHIDPRPDLRIALVHLFSVFGSGIAMSLWVWNQSTLDIWKRSYRRLFNQPLNEPQRITRKSKMISKAFAKQKADKHMGSDLSLSFESASHEDPMGMNLNFHLSEDSSGSEWANVPKRILSRRGGTTLPSYNRSHPLLKEHNEKEKDKNLDEENFKRKKKCVNSLDFGILPGTTEKKIPNSSFHSSIPKLPPISRKKRVSILLSDN